MSASQIKTERRERRKKRCRKHVFGTASRPRMSVSRSLKNIYVQLIDDEAGRTVAEASTVSKDLRGAVANGGNVAAATQVGKLLAERAKGKGIKTATLDRNGYRYHGRVKALTDAARESGLKI